MSDEHETDGANRNWRGRFVKGVSGNPTGRPRGIVSETTRIAIPGGVIARILLQNPSSVSSAVATSGWSASISGSISLRAASG